MRKGLEQPRGRRTGPGAGTPGHRFCSLRGCNIYAGSEAAERTPISIYAWIEKHLRRKVNAAKGGTGRVWERKFLGFRLDREKRIGVAPESVRRFKIKVREMWRGNQSRTSNQLRDAWVRYVRGWRNFPSGRSARYGLPAGGMDSAGTSGNVSGSGGTV